MGGGEDGDRRRYPPWVRVALVALQVLGVVIGLVLANATYAAWSQPDDPAPPTTTAVTREPAVPPDTLG